MKKIMMMAAAVAVSAMALVSCENSTKPSLNESIDSIAYNLGVAQSEGLKQYAMMQLGVDSTCIDEFIKGMLEGATNEADSKKMAYYEGLKIGRQVQDMAKNLANDAFAGDTTKTANARIIAAGLAAGLTGKAEISADSAMIAFQSALAELKKAANAEVIAKNKAYLEENGKKEGVVTTASGLQYKVLVAGDGEMPNDSTVCKVKYEGKLIDGTVFDSNLDSENTFEVNLRYPRVIRGWVEALKLMPAGSKWEVTIPSDLAYGEQNQGPIPAYSTLIFTIEVQK